MLPAHLSSISTRRSFGLRPKDIQTEDWRKLHDAGRESLTRCIGRATADAGAEGILVRPDTIIVAILTDGEKNASRTFSQAHIA